MIDRRRFLAALGGLFAAVFVKPTGRIKAVGTNPEPILLSEVFAAPARGRLHLSVWSPQNSFTFRLEGAVSPDGPWSPIEVLSSPRFVRAAFVDGERAASGPVLEAGGEYEEEDYEEDESEVCHHEVSFSDECEDCE